MKLQIVQLDKEKDYNAWLLFRNNGIGGSEIGTILGLNEYKSAHELYYQKVGLFGQMQKENIPMFYGNRQESFVASMYEYYGNSPESVITNYNSGTKQRRLFEVKGYVINPAFPHLFFSTDRLELKDPINGQKYITKKGYLYTEHIKDIVEIKTISGWAAKQWDGGIPPSYYVQLTGYMLGLGIQTGTLVSFMDGRDLSVIKFEYDEEMASNIMTITEEFWNRVLKGREAIANGEDADQFCPPPDGSKAYADFLKKRFTNPEEETIYVPDQEIVEKALTLHRLGKEIDEMEEHYRLAENTIKTYMGNKTQVDLGDYGKITWRANIKGTRTFKPLIKNVN